ETIRRTVQALEGSAQPYQLLRIHDVSPLQRQVLVEKHLISIDLLRHVDGAAVLLHPDETISIMINEEDHLRVQTLLPGQALDEAATLAFAVDDAIGAHVRYAFDPEWGFLTSCPTNTGTGMRASTMLHLPVLTQAEQMGRVAQAIAKLGLTIRGLYGEGSTAQGDLYQISNQITLGRTEQEMIDMLSTVVQQVAGWEREARQTLLQQDRVAVEDQLLRSLGIMERARRMNAKEFMQRWSALRLASCLDIVPIQCAKLDQLLVAAQPASLQQAAGETLDARQNEEKRAALVRETLA
ncbi:MAG: ATP--guanido phosphotransferase, partial [Clostridia bacterium]